MSLRSRTWVVLIGALLCLNSIGSLSFARAECLHQEMGNRSLKSIIQVAEHMTSADRGAERRHHVTAKEILSSHCFRQQPLSMNEMSDALDGATKGSPLKALNFAGTQLRDSSNILKALENLTTSSGDQHSLYSPDFSKVPSTCHRALCAAQAIFGSQMGTQLLYLYVKYGINASHFSYSNAAPWKPSELNDVILGVSDLPEGVLPLPRILELTHEPHTGDNGENVAWSTISVTDRWSNRSSLFRRITIVHEITHNIASTLRGLDHSEEWMRLGGWTYAGEYRDSHGNVYSKSVSSKPTELVSPYASENEEEDLAESAVAYRYHPAYFKRISPGKYEFVKNHIFGGVEYTDENCSAKKLSQPLW